MKIYVELDRDGVTETRGVEGSDEEVWEFVRAYERKYTVLRILDSTGAEIIEGTDIV